MLDKMVVKVHDEQAFKEMVLEQHKLGGFVGDGYKMEIRFNTRKSCIDFIGVSIEINNKVVAFCGIEVFIGQDNLVGCMHCLGVPKACRGNGHSVIAINMAEEAIIAKMPRLSKILAVSNEAGVIAYSKADYHITNNGRLSQNNKRSQIRMQKNLIQDTDTRYAAQSKPRGPRVITAVVNSEIVDGHMSTDEYQ